MNNITPTPAQVSRIDLKQGKQEESSGRGQDPLAERSRQVHKCVAEKETLEVHNWLMSTDELSSMSDAVKNCPSFNRILPVSYTQNNTLFSAPSRSTLANELPKKALSPGRSKIENSIGQDHIEQTWQDIISLLNDTEFCSVIINDSHLSGCRDNAVVPIIDEAENGDIFSNIVSSSSGKACAGERRNDILNYQHYPHYSQDSLCHQEETENETANQKQSCLKQVDVSSSSSNSINETWRLLHCLEASSCFENLAADLAEFTPSITQGGDNLPVTSAIEVEAGCSDSNNCFVPDSGSALSSSGLFSSTGLGDVRNPSHYLTNTHHLGTTFFHPSSSLPSAIFSPSSCWDVCRKEGIDSRTMLTDMKMHLTDMSGCCAQYTQQADCTQYRLTSYSPPDTSNDTHFPSQQTDHSFRRLSSAMPSHSHHIHPDPPGRKIREVSNETKQIRHHHKRLHSRDKKRSKQRALPFTIESIVKAPVDTFNEMLVFSGLTEAQMSLMRDIRRRGKNKMAARHCRKRKLDALVSVSTEMREMDRLRERLKTDRQVAECQLSELRQQYCSLYRHIMCRLQDEHGRPYDVNRYCLQHVDDGEIVLVSADDFCSRADASYYCRSLP